MESRLEMFWYLLGAMRELVTFKFGASRTSVLPNPHIEPVLPARKRRMLHEDIVAARPQPKVLRLPEDSRKMYSIAEVRLGRGDETAHAAMGGTRVGAPVEPLAPGDVEPVA